MLCRTASQGSATKTFKQNILEKCDIRNDEWSAQVRLCVEGALSDLHAADGRYHVDCMTNFMKINKSQYDPKCSMQQQQEQDEALKAVIAG